MPDSEADPDDQAAANSSDASIDSPSLPEGKELIEYLKTLIKEIQEDTKAMLALPSVRWGFSDAVTASIVIMPFLLACAVIAAIAIPLKVSESELPTFLIAGTTGIVTLVAAAEASYGSLAKRKSRRELEDRVVQSAQKRHLLTRCHAGCLDVIAEKLERDKHKLDKRHERDMEKKHGGHAAGSASAGSKKEVAVATLQEKYEAGCKAINDKRTRGIAVLDETYQPKIKAIEAKGREKIDEIKADCEEKQNALTEKENNGKRWRLDGNQLENRQILFSPMQMRQTLRPFQLAGFIRWFRPAA